MISQNINFRYNFYVNLIIFLWQSIQLSQLQELVVEMFERQSRQHANQHRLQALQLKQQHQLQHQEQEVSLKLVRLVSNPQHSHLLLVVEDRYLTQ